MVFLLYASEQTHLHPTSACIVRGAAIRKMSKGGFVFLTLPLRVGKTVDNEKILKYNILLLLKAKTSTS